MCSAHCLRANIEFVFIFNCSLANFSNPFTFKHLNDADIASVERLIRTKTIHVLEKDLNESVLGKQTDREADVLIDDDTLKEYFGDVYYNDTHNFEFLPGDRKFIGLLVDHVQKTVDKKGDNKGLRNYQPKCTEKSNKPIRENEKNIKVKIGKEETEKSVADDVDGYESDGDSNGLAEMKLSLLSKIMDYLLIYKVNEIVDLENVPDNMVSVSIQNKKIEGRVHCIICQNDKVKKKQKPKRVSFNDGYWIPSNFITHLKIVHKLKPSSTKKNIATKRVSTSREDHINKRIKTEKKSDDAVCSLNTQQTWYDQMSKQIATMSRAVHENFEEETAMQFYTDENDLNSLSNIKVVRTQPDGNCMLSSSAHQVSHYKINSSQLKNTYKQMRANAVKYIQENYNGLKNAIKGHVYDIRDEDKRVYGDDFDNSDVFDIEKECSYLVNHLLPKDRCWTGTETLLALSSVYEVNIIVINENGPVILASTYNKIYNSSILLAYRIAQGSTELSRNHYDSVTAISSDVLHSISQALAK